MDELLKQRLAGAAVLVALAVLLLPALLRGTAPVGEPRTAGWEQPVQFTIIDTAAPPHAAPLHESQPVEPLLSGPVDPPRTPASVIESATAPRPPVPASTALPPAAVPPAFTPIEPERTATQPASPPPITKPTDTRVAAAKPAAVPKTAAERAGSWVVQVGVFADEANARRLSDRLAARSHPAYVEQVRLAGKNLFRVRVGPKANAAEARVLREQLAGALNVKPILAAVR